MRRLLIPTAIRDELVVVAREGAPAEVCGILAGKSSRTGGESAAEKRVVERQYPMENAAVNQILRYEIDSREQLAVMEEIKANGRDVVGFYHSHPAGPPGPSATDAAEATWPGKSYAILFREAGEWSVGSWNWTGEEFVREEIQIRE